MYNFFETFCHRRARAQIVWCDSDNNLDDNGDGVNRPHWGLTIKKLWVTYFGSFVWELGAQGRL